jgi:hypothetical protein
MEESMKCYYHNEINAVATCKKCNKHLCKECYDLGNGGLCSSCSEINRKRLKEARIDGVERNYGRYIRSSNLSAILGALLALPLIKYLSSSDSLKEMYIELPRLQALAVHGIASLILILATAYTFFALYAGFSITSKHILKSRWIIIVLLICWPLGLLLIVMSILLGYYASIPLYIKNIIEYKRAKREIVNG